MGRKGSFLALRDSPCKDVYPFQNCPLFLYKAMKKSFLALLFFLAAFSVRSLSAQEVALHFPYFAGQGYHFIVIQGDKSDTVGLGVIPSDGRLTLRLPETRKKYAGMARWMLTSGGGLDFVLNGENFSVECLSATPNESNIVYRGTRENDFLNANFREQERLLAQYEAMQLAVQAYPPDAPLYATFDAEKRRVEQAYATFQENLSKTDLYAARFREIVNVTRGMGTTLGGDEARKAAETDDFISRRMSWPALYTSNHWGGVIYSWMQMHLYVIQSDSALLGSARRILSRLPDPELYTSFCENLALYLVKNSKDSVLAALAPDIRSSGKLLRYDGLLSQFNNVQVGEQAPELLLEGKWGSPNQPSRTVHASDLSPKGTVLVFYQSGCGPCESALEQLIAQYPILQNRGYRLLALSADTDRKLFEETAAAHPWPDKYCDGKGFDGANFRKYGIAGTPTLFVLDKNGKILTRAGGVPEIMAWLGKE